MDDILIRKTIVKSWNNSFATGKVNGVSRILGEFKAVTNAGDFLCRKNYVCGMNLFNLNQNCDNTGIQSSSANSKFVPDSSEYTKYKKQRAYNRNFNGKVR